MRDASTDPDDITMPLAKNWASGTYDTSEAVYELTDCVIAIVTIPEAFRTGSIDVQKITDACINNYVSP